jgi:hypothetical protein
MSSPQLTVAIAVIASLVAAVPALARPPTVQNWPGYEQRLKESREAPAPKAPVATTPSADSKRRAHHKRKPAGPT